MRTEDLVSLLAADNRPVADHAVARRLGSSLAWGVPLALLLMVLTQGLRPDLAQAAQSGMFWWKIVFAGGLACASFAIVERLARPGVPVGAAWTALATPLILAWLAATLVLLQTEPAQRTALVFGGTWRTCPLNIAWISLPIMAAVVWAMKGLAPTRLPLAGAAAGLLAGCLGALVYALRCTESGVPFMAIWYVVGISIPAAVGAAMGSRWLHW